MITKTPESLPVEDALARIAAAHSLDMDLGLERLRSVALRAGLLDIDVPMAIVAGTNGKGSTVACLEAIWRAAGRRTGAFTSPHLIRFNERIRIDGMDATDEQILSALDQVTPHIAPDTLTYFEAAALAAIVCFQEAGCDAIVLEVGLGGRLDATNLWDADGAILTSVALDHAEWLGSDLRVIATEKAAVARRGGVLVVGELDPPDSLGPWARQNGVELVPIEPVLRDLAAPAKFPGEHHRRNAACAATLALELCSLVPVSEAEIRRGLAMASIPGRLQSLRVDGVNAVLDVAHNPAAAAALTTALRPETFHVVFAALGDKDIDGMAQALMPIARSVACPLIDSGRSLGADELAKTLGRHAQHGVVVEPHGSVQAAWEAAAARARIDAGRVLVVGSHVTAGEWLARYGAESGAEPDADRKADPNADPNADPSVTTQRQVPANE